MTKKSQGKFYPRFKCRHSLTNKTRHILVRVLGNTDNAREAMENICQCFNIENAREAMENIRQCFNTEIAREAEEIIRQCLNADKA